MSYDAYRPRTTSQKLSLPLNGTIFTTTREVAAEKGLPLVGTSGAQIGPAFADTVVIESTEVPNADGTKKVQTLIHARIPTEAEQLSSNWEWASCSIGGQRFAGVTRTVICPASEFSVTDPEPASPMPISAEVDDVPGSDHVFSGQYYVLTGRRASRAGMQLEPVFRVEVREYVRRVTMVNVGIDSLSGKPLFEFTTLYHASETVPGTSAPLPVAHSEVTAAALFSDAGNPWWGIQENGVENSAQQVSAEWYAMVSAQVIGGTFHASDGDVPAYISVASNSGNTDYRWPAVLEGIDWMSWPRRDGGVFTVPRVVLKREAYRGPCRSTTFVSWSKTPFGIPVSGQMIANSIYYASPFFTLNIPACLHGPVTLQCDIGNADPEWAQASGSARILPPTSPADWPSSIVSHDDQEIHRGGYLRTTRIILSPLGGASSGMGGTTTGGSSWMGGDLPPILPPTDITLTSPSSSGVHLTWIPFAGATGHIIEVKLASATWDNYLLYYMPTELTFEDLEPLAPSTSYNVRIRTMITSGVSTRTSLPSAAVNFTTLAP